MPAIAIDFISMDLTLTKLICVMLICFVIFSSSLKEDQEKILTYVYINMGCFVCRNMNTNSFTGTLPTYLGLMSKLIFLWVIFSPSEYIEFEFATFIYLCILFRILRKGVWRQRSGRGSRGRRRKKKERARKIVLLSVSTISLTLSIFLGRKNNNDNNQLNLRY